MITFTVVKEPDGWAVRMGQQMTTPFWSRHLAIREAECMADAIRRHGQGVDILIDEEEEAEVADPCRSNALQQPVSGWNQL